MLVFDTLYTAWDTRRVHRRDSGAPNTSPQRVEPYTFGICSRSRSRI